MCRAYRFLPRASAAAQGQPAGKPPNGGQGPGGSHAAVVVTSAMLALSLHHDLGFLLQGLVDCRLCDCQLVEHQLGQMYHDLNVAGQRA